MSHPTITQSRILALDMGRGLAVLLMVLVHTLWMYADSVTQTQSLLGQVVHFIGKGSAAFLICMGVSLVFARNQSAAYVFKRGLLILGIGFLLNAAKFVIPTAIGLMPDAFIQAYGWTPPLTYAQYTYLLLTGDILQLAGSSLLILALLQRWLYNKIVMLTTAVLLTVFAKVFSGVQLGIPGVDYVLRLLFSDSWQVYFPVLPWASFIFFGVFIGLLLKENSAGQHQILDRLPWAGLPALAIGGALCWFNFDYHFADFFHLGPGGVVYLLGVNILLLWAIHRMSHSQLSDGALAHIGKLLSYCSRRVTSLYVIQWSLICWGMGLIGYQTLNAGETMLAMTGVLGATFALQVSVDALAGLPRRTTSTATPINDNSQGQETA